MDDRATELIHTRPCWKYRHSLAVRIAHWTNAVCVFGLILSGFQIFSDVRGEGSLPGWATFIHTIGMGRSEHFLFAWVFVANGIGFTLYAISSRHLWDLLPFLKTSGRYNLLQRLAYTGVIFGLGPLVAITGAALSPRIDALIPILNLLGGRQAAKTLHLAACFGLIGYIMAHLTMVATTGFWNNLRSMLTGWYSADGLPHQLDKGHKGVLRMGVLLRAWRAGRRWIYGVHNPQ